MKGIKNRPIYVPTVILIINRNVFIKNSKNNKDEKIVKTYLFICLFDSMASGIIIQDLILKLNCFISLREDK